MEQRTWPALNEHDHAPEAGADPPAGRPPGRPERADSDPDFFRLQWEAAEAMAAEERWQDAARLWERLLSQKRRLPPGDAARVQRRLAAAYVHLALQRKPLEGSRRNALQAVGLLEKAAALDDRQPAPLYWCGVIYRWFGLWEKAADFFRRALEIDPAHLPSRLELGWTLLRLGELDQVRALLAGPPGSGPDASTGDGPADWHWRRLKAAALLAEEQAAEALAAYPAAPGEGVPASQWAHEFLHLAEAASRRDPAAVLRRLEAAQDAVEMLFAADQTGHGGPEPGGAGGGDTPGARGGGDPRQRWHSLTSHLQALAAEARGELDAALTWWRRACEADPQDDRRRLHLVAALVRQGAGLWRAGRVDDAVAAWAEARQRGGQDPNLLRGLALGYERLERWLEANQCWEDYLRLQPEGDAATPRGAVLLAMAANAARAGRRDDAHTLLGRAARAVADSPDLLTYAGLLYVTLGSGQRAVAALTRVLELKPGDEAAVQGLLHAASLPDVDAAPLITGLREAVRRLPRDGWAFQHWRAQALALGRRLWESGTDDQAMEVFASLLLADPGDIDAWLWAGAVHARKGNHTGAEDCFAEAIRLDPQRSLTYVDLGARFLAAGDRERAEAHFEQAVQAEPGPHTHVTIGELCAEIGVPDLAERHFRASLAGGRGVEPLLVRAILGLVRTGYEDRVRPFLEEAYKHVPDSIQVRVLLAVQHLRQEEWVAADEALRQAEEMARSREAANLLAHVDYFRRALILLRTIGYIDQEEFRERVKTLLGEWLQASSQAVRDPAGPPVEPPAAILARLPAPVAWEPPPAMEAPVPGTAAPVAPTAADIRLFWRTPLSPIYVPPLAE